MYKDISCGELRAADAGRTVRLAGWVHRRRDHGGLTFIDLRDDGGLVQLVFNPDNVEPHEAAHRSRNEWVLAVEGRVQLRDAAPTTPKMAPGEVEVVPTKSIALNEALPPPFYINEPIDVDEQLRIKYRYLDLRRAEVIENIRLRHDVV